MYLPAADLYQGDLAQLGFVPEHLGLASFSQHLAADVSTFPDGLILVVSTGDLTARGLIGEDNATRKIFGKYTEVAPGRWLRQVRRSGAVMILAGPLRTPTPLDEDLEGVMTAVAALAVGTSEAPPPAYG